MLKASIRASVMVLLSISTLLTSPTIINSSVTLEAYEVRAVNSTSLKNPTNTIKATIKARADERAERLTRFLRKQSSPMTAEASALIDIADRYNLDWKLLPAIAGVESTFGQYLLSGSYNPYGWSNGNFYFPNWTVASEQVAREMKARWGNLGKITPWNIGPSYAQDPRWAAKVSFYMSQIDQIR